MVLQWLTFSVAYRQSAFPVEIRGRNRAEASPQSPCRRLQFEINQKPVPKSVTMRCLLVSDSLKLPLLVDALRTWVSLGDVIIIFIDGQLRSITRRLLVAGRRSTGCST
jgi:hypothetical protein